jgi:phosphoribosylformimino-5-aminoimidazole carboxamide ribotide isomerase
MFTIYPAIDLKGGRVVRLRQGRADAETVYGTDPAAVARDWAAQGAQWLHVVDLDGAFTGKPCNWESVQAVLNAVRIPVQLGGGLRTREQIRAALDMGVRRCVIGSKALELGEETTKLAADLGDRIAVGIDARDGRVAVRGWTEQTGISATVFAKQVSEQGFQHIIFTDISTDGMLVGPNCDAISALCSEVNCNIIASGGVSTALDVAKLRAIADTHKNLVGVIVGKALYDGRVRLSDLLTSGS